MPDGGLPSVVTKRVYDTKTKRWGDIQVIDGEFAADTFVPEPMSSPKARSAEPTQAEQGKPTPEATEAAETAGLRSSVMFYPELMGAAQGARNLLPDQAAGALGTAAPFLGAVPGLGPALKLGAETVAEQQPGVGAGERTQQVRQELTEAEAGDPDAFAKYRLLGQLPQLALGSLVAGAMMPRAILKLVPQNAVGAGVVRGAGEGALGGALETVGHYTGEKDVVDVTKSVGEGALGGGIFGGGLAGLGLGIRRGRDWLKKTETDLRLSAVGLDEKKAADLLEKRGEELVNFLKERARKTIASEHHVSPRARVGLGKSAKGQQKVVKEIQRVTSAEIEDALTMADDAGILVDFGPLIPRLREVQQRVLGAPAKQDPRKGLFVFMNKKQPAAPAVRVKEGRPSPTPGVEPGPKSRGDWQEMEDIIQDLESRPLMTFREAYDYVKNKLVKAPKNWENKYARNRAKREADETLYSALEPGNAAKQARAGAIDDLTVAGVPLKDAQAVADQTYKQMWSAVESKPMLAAKLRNADRVYGITADVLGSVGNDQHQRWANTHTGRLVIVGGLGGFGAAFSEDDRRGGGALKAAGLGVAGLFGMKHASAFGAGGANLAGKALAGASRAAALPGAAGALSQAYSGTAPAALQAGYELVGGAYQAFVGTPAEQKTKEVTEEEEE